MSGKSAELAIAINNQAEPYEHSDVKRNINDSPGPNRSPSLHQSQPPTQNVRMSRDERKREKERLATKAAV